MITSELKKRIKEDIKLFEVEANKYYNGEISLKEFKHFSGGFGSYGQRGGKTFMLRLRLNSHLTIDTLKFVCDIIKKYNLEKLHFTTCQTIQIHNISVDKVVNIMNEALDNGIICRGGGGDWPRNVMYNPLSGTLKDEGFDVTPYAYHTADYLLSVMYDIKLPRKLKVSFTSSLENESHSTFRDLGFVANNDQTFDCYICGGLGSNHKMGVKVGDHFKKEDLLYYVKAMITFFMKYGNYENRAKARTRFIQETLGTDFKDKFDIELKEAYKDNSLKSNIKENEITKVGNELIEETFNIKAQKQKGLYSYYYHPTCGDISKDKLLELYSVIKDFKDVEIRITPQQGIYVINLTKEELLKVQDVLNDGATTVFETSVSCVGATVCQVGLRDSKGTLKNIINEIKKDKKLSSVLPRIYLSGCPSSCGTHQTAPLGFQGAAKVVDKKALSAFNVYANGEFYIGKESFGKLYGSILETDMLNFIKDLAEDLIKNKQSFKDYIKDDSKFLVICSKYI